MKSLKPQTKYLLSATLLMLIGLPLLLQVLTYGTLFVVLGVFDNDGVASVVAVALVNLAAMYILSNWVAKRGSLPKNAFVRYLPIAAAFFYYMMVYIMFFELFGQRGAGYSWMLTLPFFMVSVLAAFGGDSVVFVNVFVVLYGAAALVFALCCVRHKRKSVNKKGALLLLTIAVLLCGIVRYQFVEHSRRILGADHAVEKVDTEVNLSQYEPFRPGNKLHVLPTPSLAITNDYPRLDGATAAYPVYGAMAQAIYKGVGFGSAQKFVTCSNTPGAYERLINGDIDIFFGARPSQQHIAQAAAKGIAFHRIPIAKEAFVFFVNRQNPVGNLTVPQLQNIYQKRITNWRTVGGNDERIMPFQRNENSGSQTVMQKFMGDKPLPPPLREEYSALMGGIINQVAAYRNYTGAIGYSFRFYATEMNPNADIKLLAVDGVAPSVANIRTGAYPLTEHVYAVTTREPDGNVKALLDWILSPEGQAAVEQCGYVGIAE